MARLIDRVFAKAPAPTTRTRTGTLNSGGGYLGTGGNSNDLEVYKALSTLQKVVSLRASSVAQVEWALYQKPTGRRRNTELADERTPVDNHRALEVWGNPNPQTTATRFRKTWSMHLDLVGEAFVAPDRLTNPTELWQYRPDRMTPNPDPNGGIGWICKHPDGRETTDFAHGEVFPFIDPDPFDLLRGCSPVQSLLVDIESNKAATEWNRSFFLNGAQLGGVLAAEEGLTDDEREAIADQFRQNHTGAQNAGRWMLFEGVDPKPFPASHKDMEFEKLRILTSDLVREAYAMPKTLLGIGESVNRATAQAAWAIYLQQEIMERLVELRRWLNTEFLPLFGRAARSVEFDFVDPVADDHEKANAELDTKTKAAATLVAAGWDPDQVLETVGLPPMDLKAEPEPEPEPEPDDDDGGDAGPVPPQLLPNEDQDDPDEAEGDEPEDRLRAIARFRNQDDRPPDLNPEDLPDVSGLQESFRRVLDRLFADWETIENTQKALLVEAVRQIIINGDPGALADLGVDTATAEAALADAMSEMAEDGAQAAATEIEDQGEQATPAPPDEEVIAEGAAIIAALIAGRLIASATSTAMRHNSRGATADEVADAVAEGLAGLSLEGPRPQLSGALTGAQNDGRIQTIKRAPSAALYANEVNDANTCSPCSSINGKWLGNTEDMDEVLKLYPGGAYGGYVGCDGGPRCRGTIVAVYRPARVPN